MWRDFFRVGTTRRYGWLSGPLHVGALAPPLLLVVVYVLAQLSAHWRHR